MKSKKRYIVPWSVEAMLMKFEKDIHKSHCKKQVDGGLIFTPKKAPRNARIGKTEK